MKKTILSVILTVSALAGFSQITFIPKAGVVLSTIHQSKDLKSDDVSVSSKIGFVFGAGLELKISEKFTLQPELLFIQKGYKVEESYYFEEARVASDVENKANIRLNYLELPIMFKMKFNNFYINAGPSFSYGIGGNFESEVSTFGVTESETSKVKFGKEPDNNDGDNFYYDNAFDLGVQLGAGIKVGPVVIDLRYGLGLSNLNDKPKSFEGSYAFQNRALQLSVGFPIGVN